MRQTRLGGRLERLEISMREEMRRELEAMSAAQLAALIGPDYALFLDSLSEDALRELAYGPDEAGDQALREYKQWYAQRSRG